MFPLLLWPIVFGINLFHSTVDRSRDVAEKIKFEWDNFPFESISLFFSSLIPSFLSEGVSDLHLRLLREFSLILVGNVVLVWIAWKVYGPRISDRFMNARSGRKVIEELRTSMSELKLPKEHDFKYK